MSERKEVFMRIVVVIVSGIMLYIWAWLIYFFVVVNFLHTLFTGFRYRELAEVSEIWNTQKYIFWRYIIFQSNKRPFPFEKLEKNISKHDSRPPRHFRKRKYNK